MNSSERVQELFKFNLFKFLSDDGHMENNKKIKENKKKLKFFQGSVRDKPEQQAREDSTMDET